MASIQVSELNKMGSLLFSDDESYLIDLASSDLEVAHIYGGCLPFAIGVLFGATTMTSLTQLAK